MPILAPKTTLNIIGASTVQQNAEQKVLLTGQMLTGTAVAGVPVQCPNSTTEINALFGAKSHAAYIARAFKLINKASRLDILPLADNGSGVFATATLTCATGTSTADATIIVFVGDQTNLRVSVTIASGSDQAAAAAAIKAAYDTILTTAPWAATVSTNVVTLTASNRGTWSNNAPIGVEGTIPGIAITIAAFASGATDPTLTNVLDAIGGTRYQTFGWPTGYARTVLKTLLTARFNDEFRAMDGVGIQFKTDTYANLSAGPTDNSQSLAVFVDKTVARSDRKGGAVMSLNDSKMAALCAIRSLRLTEDASLTGTVTTVASNDQFGGIALASLPYANTVLAGLSVPNPEDEFTPTEMQALTTAAYSTIGANAAFNTVICGTAVTTYKTNAAGDVDTSFKYLNTVDSSSAIREYYIVNLKSRYAQTRLTNGELLPGRDMANAASVRTFLERLYGNLADDALVEKGAAALRFFKTNTLVTVSVSEGKVTINMAPYQVGQWRTTLGTIAVNFSS